MTPLEEKHLLSVVTGYRHTIAIISHAKWVLTFPDTPSEFRLETLQYFDKFTDGSLTADMIAMIEPMKPEGREIFDEARKLVTGGNDRTGWNEFFNVISRKDVWLALGVMHPSFVDVARAMNRGRRYDEEAPATSSTIPAVARDEPKPVHDFYAHATREAADKLRRSN